MLKKSYYLAKLGKISLIEILLGLLCTLFLLAITYYSLSFFAPFIEPMDNKIYDQIINLNEHSIPQNPKVIIVNIDEYSVKKEGRWPWPRDKMARLISNLKQNGVVTIGLDMVMSEAEINYAQGLQKKLVDLRATIVSDQSQLINTLKNIAPKIDNDQTFTQTLLDHNVVIGFLFQHESDIKKGNLPLPLNYQVNEPIMISQLPLYQFEGYNGILDLFLKASTEAGFVTNLPDKDGIIRHALVIAKYNNQLYPSLALKIAMNYLLINDLKLLVKDQRLYGIQLEGLFIPTNSHGQILIPYWGKAGTLDYYSATDIINNKINKQDLDGSIAIVGSSMTLLSDLHNTPVNQLFPGVELVSNIVLGITSQQLVSTYHWHTTQGVFIFLFLGLLGSFLFPFLDIIGKLVVTVGAIFFILITTYELFVWKHFYFPSASLITLITLQALVNYGYSYVRERRQKRKINLLFGQYVPKDYVKELIESPEHHNMEGQTLNMTVLFADIRNFTATSETLDATEVKHLLNTFFTPITEIIFRHRGTIDKYVGDMIVAFWGAPLSDDKHAYNAIMASLEIFRSLPNINIKMIDSNLPPVHIGLGLATGLMNVGDMGSEFRRAYTVLGDTVNLASRLQDLTKFYQVDILVNDAAYLANNNFLWRTIDKVSVKGRKTALTLYQPLGMLTEASSITLQELELYHNALIDYYAQNWSIAETKFKKLKSSFSNLYLYQLYLERIQSFKKAPPGKHWDGVFNHLHK